MIDSPVAEGIHIKDGSSEIGNTDNDLVNRDAVGIVTDQEFKNDNVMTEADNVDICDKDTMKDVTADVNKQVGDQINSENCPPVSQSEIEERQKSLDSDKSVIHKRKMFPCDHCDKKFQDSSRLFRHMVKDHDIEDKDAGMSRCMCELCGKVYISQDELTKHRLMHRNVDRDEYKYNCSYCERIFTKRHRKRCHEQSHTKNYTYKCRFCDYGSPFRKAMLTHEARVHNCLTADALYTCSVCGVKFIYPSELARHETIHHNNLPVRCEICDKTYKNMNSLKHHLLTCHRKRLEIRGGKGSDPGKSGITEASSAKGTDLVSPVEPLTIDGIQIKIGSVNTHCTDNQLFVRNTDNVDISDQTQDLVQADISDNDCMIVEPNSEIRETQERKIYSCDHCDKSFNYWSRLVYHEVSAHGIEDKISGVSRCTCEMCGKAFSSRDELTKHISRHKLAKKDDFKHRCSYCERMFKTRYRKNLHEQTHTKNYKFKCRFCDKGFAMGKFMLLHEAKKHNAVNADLNVYTCPVCDKRFFGKMAFAVHESYHSKNHSNRCELCTRKFKTDKHLKKHLRTCKVALSRKLGKEGPDEEKNADVRESEKSQKEPMQQVSPAGKANGVALSETLITEEIHIKDELIELDCSTSNFVDQDTVNVDISDLDHSNDVTADDGNQLVLQSKPETCTPVVESSRDANLDTGDIALDVNKQMATPESQSTQDAIDEDISVKEVTDHATTVNVNNRRTVQSSSENNVSRCTCAICGRVFRSTDAFATRCPMHKQVNKDDFIYHCKYCERRFRTSHRKNVHEQIHTKNYKHQCRFCDKGFAVRKNWLVHEANKHKSIRADVNFYPCSVCGKRFFGKFALAIHQAYHNKTLPHRCKLCDKRFSSSEFLRYHMRICQLSTSRKRGTEESGEKETADIRDPEDSQIEQMGQQAGRMHVVASSESVIAEEIHIKDELIELDCTNHDLVDKDCSNEITADANNQEVGVDTSDHNFSIEDVFVENGGITALQSNVEECTIKFDSLVSQAKIKQIKPTVSDERVINTWTVYCDHCDKRFTNKRSLIYHRLRTHGIESSDADVFRCDICGGVCYSEHALAKHRSMHNKVKNNALKYQCSYCIQGFKKLSHKRSHELTHTKNYKNKCRFCGKGFLFKKLMLCHEAEKHNSVTTDYTLYPCPVCGKFFPSPSAFARHKLVHVNVLPYKCKLCNRRYKNKQGLVYHLRCCEQRTGESESIPEKNAAHDNNQITRNHEENSSESQSTRDARDDMVVLALEPNEQVSLQSNPESTSGSSSVRESVEIDPDNSSSESCDLCGKVCFGSNALARHRSTHKEVDKGEFIHRCSYCERTFRTRQSKFNHEQTHTRNYRFRCRFCSMGFPIQKRLIYHEAKKHNSVTTDIAFHSCSVCDNYFLTPSALTLHEATHSNKTLYSCELCDKKFNCIPKKNYHMRTCQHSAARTHEGNDGKKTADIGESENAQIEPEQRGSTAAETDDAPLLKPFIKDETYITDELTESNCMIDDSLDRNPVKVDIAGQDHSSDDSMVLQSKLEESTPEPQTTRDASNSITEVVNPEKNTASSQMEIGESQKPRKRQRAPTIIKNKSLRTNRKRHCCDLCNKMFPHWPTLLCHRVREHGIDDKDAGVQRCPCEICGRVYVTKDALAKHHLTHETVNGVDFKYHCSFCERMFQTKKSKIFHEQTHTKNYPHRCRFCDKGFSVRVRLLYHETKKHNFVTADTTFLMCPVCGQYFLNPSALELHKATHSTNLSYKCELCDRRFKSTKDRQYHLRACQLSRSRSRNKKESNKRIADMSEPNHQIESMQQQDSPAAVTDTGALLEEILVKDNLTDSVDCANDVAAENTNPMTLQTAPDGGTMESQSTLDAVVNVNSEKNPSESESGIRKLYYDKRKRQYRCNHCDKSFPHWPRFLRHQVAVHGIENKHAGLSRCVCDLCGKVCVNKDTLTMHRLTHRNASKEDFKYKCSYCERLFRSKYGKEHHEQTHTRDYKHKCRFCDMGFPQINRLLFHEAKKHNYVTTDATFFSCSVCGEYFLSAYALSLHESTHSDNRSYGCEFCDKKFKLLQNKTYHQSNCEMRERKGSDDDKLQIEPMVQQISPAAVSTVALTESLITEEIHIKDEIIDFDYTNNDLDDQDTVEVDINPMTLQSNPEESTPESRSTQDAGNIDISDKVDVNNQMTVRRNFQNSSSRSRAVGRVKRVIPTRKYCCDHCDKMYSHWSGLLYHQVLEHGIEDKEAGISRCTCELCGKAYHNEDLLAKHRSTHKNETKDDYSYPCSYCTRKFTMNTRKLFHEQTHTKNYTYKCRFCDEGFPARKRLLFHEAKKHNSITGEIASHFYTCPVCDKYFLSPSALRTHSITHSNNPYHKCELCDRKFKTFYNLQYHMRYCKLKESKIRTRTEAGSRKTTLIKTFEKPQKEPVQQQASPAVKTDVAGSSEGLPL